LLDPAGTLLAEGRALCITLDDEHLERFKAHHYAGNRR
jgi:hypothetical protein